jgi:hypothetical protein
MKAREQRDPFWVKSRGKPNQDFVVGFEVLTAVVMKSSIFWNIRPCSPSKVNRCFDGTCRLHLQTQRISRARNQCKSRWQAEPFRLSTDYTVLYPRRQNSSIKDPSF